MEDVYNIPSEDEFPGARPRTRPGTSPGEAKYDPVVDAHGTRVSGKPANRAILKGQKDRLNRGREQERAREQRERLAVFLPLLSNFLSETYTFGLVDAIRPTVVQAWHHPSNPFNPPKELTLVQLAAYDGRENNPVYLSIGGEIYDVSANRRVYGKGGSYNMMTGRDASRAFVTGCFQTHLTHDLRGLSEEELQSLEHWKSFFANHKEYHRVGRTILPPVNPNSPIPPPCRGKDAPGAGAAAHGAGKPRPVAATGN